MFDSLYNFPDEFERLRQEFDDLFGAVGMPTGIRSVARGAFPAINVGNTPQSLEIYAFAPGVDASKVEVTVDRGVLTLAGERPSALPEGGNRKVNVYSRERVGGTFRRAISLPDDADPSKVEATYSDGVLHISIARREAAQPKRIAVQ